MSNILHGLLLTWPFGIKLLWLMWVGDQTKAQNQIPSTSAWKHLTDGYSSKRVVSTSQTVIDN
jgi:hypothetical protein